MLLATHDGPPAWALAVFDAGARLVKSAGDAVPAYGLVGTLYLSSSGWLLLSVPNALVRGAFAAMGEPGIELPPGPDGKLNAHISVIRQEEIERIGGPEKITERGKQFRYRLGGFYSIEPDNWVGVNRVWYMRVHSPELQDLRKSYGLTPLPNGGKYDFHIAVAIRRRGVLGTSETSKIMT